MGFTVGENTMEIFGPIHPSAVKPILEYHPKDKSTKNFSFKNPKMVCWKYLL